jgi:hypothetical protein
MFVNRNIIPLNVRFLSAEWVREKSETTKNKKSKISSSVCGKSSLFTISFTKKIDIAKSIIKDIITSEASIT